MTLTADRPVTRQDFSALDEGVTASERAGWPLNVGLEVLLRHAIAPARLSAALATAVQRHPLAGARRLPARAFDRQATWLLGEPVEDLVRCSDRPTGELLDEVLPLDRAPRVRAWLRTPEPDGRQRLVLSAHHAALDGAAAVVLLRTVAAALGGAPLPPAVERPEQAPAPAPAPAALAGSAAQVFLAPRADPLAPGPAVASSGTGYGVCLHAVGVDLTAALLAARTPTTTVNDLLLAAVHRAADLWNRRHGAPAGLLSVVMPVRPAPAAARPAVTNATLQAVTRTRPDQRSTPAGLLGAVSQQSRQVKDGAGAAEPSAALQRLGVLPLKVRAALPRLADALSRGRSVATTRLSNLGLQPEAGLDDPAFEVEELWFSPPCRPPQSLVLGALTFRGQLRLSARFCRPDHDELSAGAFLLLVEQALGELLTAAGWAVASQSPAPEVVGPLPSGLRRTARYVQLFREEQRRPEAFYTFLARDTVAQVGAYRSLAGAEVLDVGGGPGYLADALEAAGARCTVLEYAADELTLFGRSASSDRRYLLGDGCALPLRDGSVDVVTSSNVLEHVPDPQALLREAVRVLRPGGVAFITVTNWYSPWGGHETSPWHYLGGDRAVARYERRSGLPAKNRFGESLFPVHVGQTLAWARSQPDLRLLDAFPRYWPSWTRPLLRVPGAREIGTWNLVLVLTRRT